eukprot:gene13372-3907_t
MRPTVMGGESATSPSGVKNYAPLQQQTEPARPQFAPKVGVTPTPPVPTSLGKEDTAAMERARYGDDHRDHRIIERRDVENEQCHVQFCKETKIVAECVTCGHFLCAHHGNHDPNHPFLEGQQDEIIAEGIEVLKTRRVRLVPTVSNKCSGWLLAAIQAACVGSCSLIYVILYCAGPMTGKTHNAKYQIGPLVIAFVTLIG